MDGALALFTMVGGVIEPNRDVISQLALFDLAGPSADR
jgi:hypothetical protein